MTNPKDKSSLEVGNTTVEKSSCFKMEGVLMFGVWKDRGAGDPRSGRFVTLPCWCAAAPGEEVHAGTFGSVTPAADLFMPMHQGTCWKMSRLIFCINLTFW